MGAKIRRILRWFKIRRQNGKKRMAKELLSKNSFLQVFFKIYFYWFTFLNFWLPIWNQRKILQILVPILTYLKKKGCLFYFVKIFIWCIRYDSNYKLRGNRHRQKMRCFIIGIFSFVKHYMAKYNLLCIVNCLFYHKTFKKLI